MKKTPLTLAQKRENRRTGAMGGRARARSLTKKRRREIAIAASRVAAAKRTAKAKGKPSSATDSDYVTFQRSVSANVRRTKPLRRSCGSTSPQKIGTPNASRAAAKARTEKARSRSAKAKP